MSTVAEKLHKWSLQELNLVSEGGFSRIPNVEAFKLLTKGKNKRIWTYVINHVRSQATVDKVKRTLFLKKQLKEQEDIPVYFADDSIKCEKLEESLLKAIEKRKYLMRSLSTIEERILNLDESVQKTKDEIFQLNQKTALLEHLSQIYDRKISNLKNLISHISSYQCGLNSYQTTKIFDRIAMDLSYDFMFESKVVYDENLSRMKDLIIINSGIFKKQFNQDDVNVDILKENFLNNFVELKTCGLLLFDFIMLFKEMCRCDLQQFTNLNSQDLSVKEYIVSKTKESEAKTHFAHLKCDFIYNMLSAKKNKEKIEKYGIMKSNSLKDVLEKLGIKSSDLDYEIKFALFEKQAENDALIASNHYFENCLKDVTSKTEAVLKSIRHKKINAKDVTVVTKSFYDNMDLTYSLLYVFPSVIQKVIHYLNDLKLFACEELFKLPLPEEKVIEELNECFSSERKQTWNYCTKTKLIDSLFTETSAVNELPVEISQSLNIQPYQNLSVLCKNWARFKQKLHTEISTNDKTCLSYNNINLSEVYSKILKMLEKMKFSIEKGMLFLTYGTTCCQKNKSLIQEWWNQNAQYIPHIEYEGKTLKMWIDILLVLSDFELQNHV